MPEDRHVLLTGFYSLSRGIGPPLGGVTIQLLRGEFSTTHGFAVMWIVTSGSILASIPVLRRLCARIAVERKR